MKTLLIALTLINLIFTACTSCPPSKREGKELGWTLQDHTRGTMNR